jgi:ribosomal protein S1
VSPRRNDGASLATLAFDVTERDPIMSDSDKPQTPVQTPIPEKKGPIPPPDPIKEFGNAPKLRDLDAQIAADLEAAMGGLSDKDLYGDPKPPKNPNEAAGEKAPAAKRHATGKLVGKVQSVHGQDVFVEVPGGRSGGVLGIDQFPEGPPALGTEVEITIERYDGANGLLILTRRGAVTEADWSTVAEGQIVEARVTETNKGGLSVDVNGIRGFMPISQIDLYRVENAESFVNQRLRCMVTEVNPEERNLVVSRRALMEKERAEQSEQTWNSLAEGQIREGVVRSVRDFGAFVDIGGIDGLVHVSDMSWARVQDPTSLLQVGQAVKVLVLRIDREKRKIGLGLKQLQASPWDTIDDDFPVSSKVPGKVTKLMEFGAFVELAPGIEGLVHISELAPQRVFRVKDIVQPGQEVQVVVLKVDKQARKISLSLKAALPKPEAPKVEEEPEPEVEEAPKKPPKPRTTPLRGGTGGAANPFSGLGG